MDDCVLWTDSFSASLLANNSWIWSCVTAMVGPKIKKNITLGPCDLLISWFHEYFNTIWTTNTNLEILQRNFCLSTLWVFLQGKVFLIFLMLLVILAFYGAFWSQLKLLSRKKTQKVNKQKFLWKNPRFILVVHMRWARWKLRNWMKLFTFLVDKT